MGNFPIKAVSTMAAITANAEVGINHYQVCGQARNCDPGDRPGGRCGAQGICHRS